MNKVLVVSPHPDDETLGCGGTILKHYNQGDQIYWLIMTTTDNDNRYSVDFTANRKAEIEKIKLFYNISTVNVLDYKPATLDQENFGNIINNVSKFINKIKPNILYIPYRGDAHSDHKVTFDSIIACTKSFRSPFIKSVRVYEVLSETNFGLNPDYNGFKPNYFVDINDYIDQKMKALQIFDSELAPPPFPRNEESLRALALIRGQVAGTKAAEAFMSLKEIA